MRLAQAVVEPVGAARGIGGAARSRRHKAPDATHLTAGLYAFAILALGLLFAAQPARAQFSAKLTPETVKAFEQYEENVEDLMRKRLNGELSFLWLDEDPKLRNKALRGEIPVAKLDDNAAVPGGLIHNWIGAMFVPDATIEQLVAVFQDYANYPEIYPEVIRVKLESQSGDVFHIYQRLLKKKVLTATLDTWHEARYKKLDDRRYLVESKATKIQEVKNAGRASEKLLPVGEDSGYLWRMNLYWRLEQDDDGVFAECHSLSLSRDIPRGTGWIVKPFVNSMPRESLEKSLQATRLAVMNKK